MSGGQAKNTALMQLFANTCGMSVVLPFEHSGAVVLGAAMLGRFAAEAAALGSKEMSGEEQGEVLWKIMVGGFECTRWSSSLYFQVEMTPVGTVVVPAATVKEKKLLEAKYKIFRESIEIQKRWRKEMDDASS